MKTETRENIGTILMCTLILSLVGFMLYSMDKFHKSNHRPNNVLHDGDKIAMPEYYRRITGFDSIQVVFGGRGRYNEEKKDFDVTWDSLFANFCYPNQWQFEKFKNQKVQSITFKYDSIMILNFDSSEIK